MLAQVSWAGHRAQGAGMCRVVLQGSCQTDCSHCLIGLMRQCEQATGMHCAAPLLGWHDGRQ